MGTVNILTKGRSGTIQYIEDAIFQKNICEFYWEFGGGDTLAIIWFPKNEAEWDKQYPWAAGRRMEIVNEMAEQVRKQQAPTSTLKWEEGAVLLGIG